MLGGMALQDGEGGVQQPPHHEERIVEGQRDDANTGNNEGKYCSDGLALSDTYRKPAKNLVCDRLTQTEVECTGSVAAV